MPKLTFNCPLNGVSFGQVSVSLLREAYRRKLEVLIAMMAEKADLSQYEASEEFSTWLDKSIKNFATQHSREDPTFKLWHFNGSYGWISDNQALMSFYELDDPTDVELNIARNCRKLIFTSQYTCDVFESKGVKAHYVPLAFDKDSFHREEREYYDDDRVVFNLCGKFELRKRHAKILQAWSKKYGNNKKYLLQCSIFSPFMDPKVNGQVVDQALGHKRYWNIVFNPMMPLNSQYNNYLNSADIIIGMSGGEGWGLPEFQSVALGKHAVILDAHGYKGWANEENSVLVQPDKKIDVYDGQFFRKGAEYNQGQIYDWNEDDFIDSCEEAINRSKANRVNEKGLELQDKFTYSKTFDSILKTLES